MRVPCSNPLAIRINHVQGERLRAADLQDELGVESWMRQLHMIGLHDTWGIAMGLVATAEEGAGRGVCVAAGLAYDARGRPLLLEAPHVAPNPWASYPGADPSATFDLVLIADAERHRRPATRDDLLCLSCGVAPMRDRPALVWLPSASVRIGIDIALVRAKQPPPGEPIKPGDPPPVLALENSVRLYAETQARPHVAAATTTADQTWQPWIPSTQGNVVGFGTVVDVSDWGFASEPTLIASLSIDTSGSPESTTFNEFANDPSHPISRRGLTHFLFTRVDVDWANHPGQFRFVVMPAIAAFLDPSTSPRDARIADQSYRSPFRINWVGVEPVVGCPVGAGESLGQAVRCCEPPAQPLRFRPLLNGRLR